jgi:F-type H+-transporting ATPase subunit epsilon
MPVQLSVVTPEGPVLDRAADSVTAPGQEGEFGVLAGHEPFLAPLVPGLLHCRGAGEDESICVSVGFAEVTPERMTVLVNAAERPHEIDRERAEASRDRANERMQRSAGEVDLERAAASLARAEARLRAVSA